MKDRAVQAFNESAEVKLKFAREHADRIVQVAALIANGWVGYARVARGQVLSLCG